MNKWGWFINQRESLLQTALLSRADAWTLIDANPEYVAVGRQIRAARPDALIVIRYHQNPFVLEGNDPRRNAENYFASRYVQHREFTPWVMPLNEPQLEVVGVDPTSHASVMAMWLKLRDWLCWWVSTFKALAPEAKVLFPSPAPGVFWDDPRPGNEGDGIQVCKSAIEMCDAIGINAYWMGSGYGLWEDEEGSNAWYAFRYRRTVARTGKKVFITECNSDIHAGNWFEQMVRFWAKVNDDEDVLGATCFLLEAHDGQFKKNDVSQLKDLELVMRRFGANLEIPEDDKMALEDILREEGWNLCDVPYNPNAGLARVAREAGLGAPRSHEIERTFGSVIVVYQFFAGGCVYAKKGDWANIRWIPY